MKYTGSGSEMCDIGACKGNPTIYQPIDTVLTSVDQSVLCTAVAKTKCIVPRLTSSCVKVRSPVINEFQRQSTRRAQSLLRTEVRGEPGTAIRGVLTVIVNKPGLSSQGLISATKDITGSFDEAGLLVVQIEGLGVDAGSESLTLVMSSARPGRAGEQLDTDSNGVIDNISAFGIVFDAIGVSDRGSDGSFVYGVNLDGVDLAAPRTGRPGLVFRDSCTAQIYQANKQNTVLYDAQANPVAAQNFNVVDPFNPTFGSTNPTQRSP